MSHLCNTISKNKISINIKKINKWVYFVDQLFSFNYISFQIYKKLLLLNKYFC
jgi:hypothetical protein